MATDASTQSASWTVQTWSDSTTAVPDKPAVHEPPGQRSQTQFLLRTLTQLQGCGNSQEACRVLANRLQQFLGCRQVVVGLCSRKRLRCRVRGVSGAMHFDRHSRFLRCFQDALQETVVHNADTSWPPRQTNGGYAARAHKKLTQELGAESVVSAPLRSTEGKVLGALLLVDAPAETTLELVRDLGGPIGACLDLLSRTERGVIGRQLNQGWQLLGTRRGIVTGLLLVCLGLLLLIPWPHNIDCRCQVQPMKRRFVVAPYDGTLETSLVVPGDLVCQGDVLARMDEQEIRWELAGVEADWSRARKERDAAMASHRTSDAQLARLEMERLQLRIQLLQNRIQNLAIKSPINGIVVEGDLEKAEGAPLTIGQTLFEVAPLDKMIVEVAVPEDEISHVQLGMQVSIQLDALPDQTYTKPIGRIHPRAELRQHRSVFVTEVEIGNPHGQLRPGMNGHARVASGQRQLGWLLFHKPWRRIRTWFAW